MILQICKTVLMETTTTLSLLTTLGQGMTANAPMMLGTTPPPPRDFVPVTNATTSSVQSAFVYSIPDTNMSLARITGTYWDVADPTTITTVAHRTGRRGPKRPGRPQPPHSDFLNKMEDIVMPIAFSIGILGSLVLVPVFTCTPLKASALSHYLTAIGVADFLFLISCVPVWVSSQGYRFNNVIGVCQVTSFTLRLSRFMGTWYLLAAHVERCLVHFGSHRARVWCSTFRTKCIILGIFIISLVGFLHYIWTHVVLNYYRDPRCIIMPESVQHILKLNQIELVASVFLPMILIMLMDVALIVSLIVRQRRSMAMRGIKSNNNNSRSSSSSGNDHQRDFQEERSDGYVLARRQRSRTPSNRSGDSRPPPPHFDLSREKSCATFVVIISGLLFVGLWLPAHIYRAQMLFEKGFHPNRQEFLAMTFFEKLEKLYHIFKCFLYILLLRGFRHGILYLRHCHRKRKVCQNSLQETEV